MKTVARHVFLPAVLALLLLPAAGRATDGTDPAPAVKPSSHMSGKQGIQHVVNVLKFVSWPEDRTGTSLVLCILGDNPFGTNLLSEAERVAKSKPVRIIADVSIEFTQYCHAVFVSPSESYRLPETLRQLGGKHLLTVSDIEGFAAAGGMVEFHEAAENKVSFSVNNKAAEAQGLRISSKLLTLSR